MKIGAHVFIFQGLDQAIQGIVDRGGNCGQTFSGSPKSWSRSDCGPIANVFPKGSRLPGGGRMDSPGVDMTE